MAPLVCHPADSLTAEAGPVRRGPLCTRTPEELPVWHAARGTRRGAGGYLSVYSLKPRAHRRSRKNLKLLNTRLAQVPTTVDAGGARHHQLFEERGRTSRTDWWWWCLGEGGEMEPIPNYAAAPQNLLDLPQPGTHSSPPGRDKQRKSGVNKVGGV